MYFLLTISFNYNSLYLCIFCILNFSTYQNICKCTGMIVIFTFLISIARTTPSSLTIPLRQYLHIICSHLANGCRYANEIPCNSRIICEICLLMAGLESAMHHGNAKASCKLPWNSHGNAMAANEIPCKYHANTAKANCHGNAMQMLMKKIKMRALNLLNANGIPCKLPQTC